MTVTTATEIFLTAWRSTWDPALELLTWPRYPFRELRPSQAPDGSVTFHVAKKGYGYKNKWPRPRTSSLVVDVRSIQEALSLTLPPGYRIIDTQDQSRSILITLKEDPYHEKV